MRSSLEVKFKHQHPTSRLLHYFNQMEPLIGIKGSNKALLAQMYISQGGCHTLKT